MTDDAVTAASATAPYVPEPLVYEDFEIDEDLAVNGMSLFGTNCAICHGGGARANAMAPDLRASAVPLDAAAFTDILRAGSRVNRGMPPFAELTDDELAAMQHYIRAIAHHDAGVE